MEVCVVENGNGDLRNSVGWGSQNCCGRTWTDNYVSNILACLRHGKFQHEYQHVGTCDRCDDSVDLIDNNKKRGKSLKSSQLGTCTQCNCCQTGCRRIDANSAALPN